MKRLFIFNPGHDLALGNGDRNYVLPSSAEKFARECSGIMLPLADNQDYILDEDDNIKEFALNLHLGQNYKIPRPVKISELKNLEIRKIEPWGWDTHLKKKLEKSGIDKTLIPSDEKLSVIRELSHRRTALEAFERIIGAFEAESGEVPDFFNISMNLPEEIKSIEKAEDFLYKYHDIVLKAPWSGSGKGLRWCREKLSHSDEGWIRNTIASQGSILAEKREKIILDLAMEFSCGNSKTEKAENERKSDTVCEFKGYSLFSTKNGSYEGNLLADDARIENIIGRFIPSETLKRIRKTITEFIGERIAPVYEGPVGVDMFIYRDSQNGGYKINPCVEINLRYTMGYVFHELIRLNPSICTICTTENSATNAIIRSETAEIGNFICVTYNDRGDGRYGIKTTRKELQLVTAHKCNACSGTEDITDR